MENTLLLIKSFLQFRTGLTSSGTISVFTIYIHKCVYLHQCFVSSDLTNVTEEINPVQWAEVSQKSVSEAAIGSSKAEVTKRVIRL